MKTLVIHPDDRTTDFLKQIYEGHDWTVITEHKPRLNKKEFLKQVNEHDRIIMMGHGYPNGLFYSYIDPTIVHLLREKECICIWCNADQFVNKYGLTGFHTGMFISEVSEANWFKIETDQAEIDFSNELFTNLVADNINNPEIHSVLKESYNGESEVIQFNNDRLYYSGTVQPIEDLDDGEDNDLDPAGGYGLSSHI